MTHIRKIVINYTPLIVVTHDRADAEALNGEVVVLERGATVQRGHASATSPRTPRRTSSASS